MGLCSSAQKENDVVALEERLDDFLNLLKLGSCDHDHLTTRLCLRDYPVLANFWSGFYSNVMACDRCVRLFKNCVKDLQTNFHLRRPRIELIDRQQFIAMVNTSTLLLFDICDLVAQYGHSPIGVATSLPPRVWHRCQCQGQIHINRGFFGCVYGQQMVELVQSRENSSLMIRLSNGIWLVSSFDQPQRIEFDHLREGYIHLGLGISVPDFSTWMRKNIVEISMPLDSSHLTLTLAGTDKSLALVGFDALA